MGTESKPKKLLTTHTPYSYKRESAPRQLQPSHHHMVPAQRKTEKAGEMFTNSGAILHACPFKEIGEDSFQIRVGSHRPRQSGSQQEAINMYKWAGTPLLVQWRRHRASSAGAQVRSLGRELDPACHKEDPPPKAQHSQINKWYFFKLQWADKRFLGASCGIPMWVLSPQSCSTLCDPTTAAPLSMGFSRQEHWSGLPFPPPGDLPHPGTGSTSPVLQADSLPRR